MSGKSLVFAGVTLLGAIMLAGCGGSAANPVSVTVATTANTVDATDSVTLTATVNNDKNSAGVTWSVSGGGTLSSQTTTSAVYTAPAASSSGLTATATATSIADATKTGSVALTVPAAPSITTTASQLASSVGSAYAVTLTGSGGINPYTWAATGLPSCLTLNKTTGVLSGTVLASCAGTATPTFTLTDSGTATALTASAPLNLAITPAVAIGFTGSAPSTATVSVAYSGSAAASGGAGTLTYTQSGTWPSWLSLNGSTGAIGGTPTAIGSFSVTVQAADAYGDSATQKYTITVGKGTPNVSVWPSASAIAYGQTLASSTLSGGVASVAGSFAWTTPSTAPGAGAVSSSVTFTPNDTTDYNTTTGTVTVTVNKATPTITTSPTASALTYGQTLVSSTLSGGVASVAGSFAWTTSSTAPSGGAQPESYTFTPTDTTDYASVTQTASLQVNKATLTVTASSTTVAYGSAVPAITPNYSGFQNGDTAAALTTAPACSTTYTVASAVGTSPTTSCTGGVSSNYSFIFVSGAVTVAKATPTVTWATPTAIGYGTALSATQLNATTTVAGTFVYTPALGAILVAGSQTLSVTFTPTDTTDYASVTQTVSLLVNKATLTVTASSTTVAFGSAIPAITPSYNGLQNGDTVAVVTTAPSCSTTYTAASTVGSAPTTSCSGGVSSNYSFIFVSGAVTVAKVTPTVTWATPAAIGYGTALSATQLNATTTVAGAFVYTPALGTVLGAGSQTLSVTFTPTDTTDYASVTQPVSLLVNKATLTVTASSTTVAFGSAVPTITPSYSGFQNGDAVAVVTTVPSCSTTYTITSVVGSAQSTSCSGGVSSNYIFSYVSGTVTVTKGTPPTVTWATPAAITYGTALSATQLNATTTVAGTFVYTPALGTVLGAGSQTLSVTFTPTDTADYASVTQPVSLQVNKATLTVTASSTTVAFGSAVPTITPSYSGFQNGDTVAVVTTAPACSTTYTVASTVGSAQTTSCFGGVVGSNYIFSYVPGTVTVVAAFGITTPSPLPSGTVGVFYSQTLTASGGSGSYSWSWAATTGTLPAGLTLSSSGLIGGTPTTAGSYSVTVTVTDTVVTGKSTSAVFSIPIVNPSINGQISLLNNCAGATSVPPITVTLTSTTTGSRTTTTDSNGNYSFNNVAVGSYTITPVVSTPSSGTAPSSIFYPATQSVTVSGSSLTGQNFSATLGYAVSGYVTYRGTQSGQIYLQLSASNCGSYGALGTSIVYPFSSGGSFTINGVPPGAYVLQAWMDNQGTGVPNVINPSGSTSGVSVTNDLVRSVAITLNDPSVTAVSNATPGPTLNLVSPTDQGVVINFSPVTNSSQLEAVTSYQVQWSASSSFTGTPGSYTYAANGSGVSSWILNNGLPTLSGTLSNGTAYYFRARGALKGNNTNWSATKGPITIGAPSSSASTSSVTGTVTLPTQTSYGPLYVGFYNQVTGAIYASRIASPSSAQAYSVNVLNGSNYSFFAILDQNNNGLIDIGDITTLNDGYSHPATIGGSVSPFNYDFTDAGATPDGSNSTGVVTTQMTQSTDINSNTTTNYGLTLQVLGGIKLPVSVQLSSPSGVDYLIAPVDLAAYTGSGNAQFVYQTSTGSEAPGIYDAFTLAATYSDSTSETVLAQVTGAGATYSDPNSGATSPVAAVGLTLLSNLTQPNFLWVDPANPGDYTYSFSLSDSNGNILWQIPSSASKERDMGSSITQITWGTDPTGNTSNKPTVTSLTSGKVYTWSIQLVDSDGNTSTTQVSFQP